MFIIISVSSPEPLCDECVAVFCWSSCGCSFGLSHVPEHEQQLIAGAHLSNELSALESGQSEPQDIRHSMRGGRISLHRTRAHRRGRLYLHILSRDTDQVSTHRLSVCLCVVRVSLTHSLPQIAPTGTQTVAWLACSMAPFLLCWTA